jgi:IS30 family transposase
LSVAERVEIVRLHKQGLRLQRIAKEMSRSWWTVQLVLRPTVATRERLWEPSSARLSMTEREEIRSGIVAGDTFKAIAGRLGRAVSTISREVANNGGRSNYRAYRAHRRAARCARRPKHAKLEASGALRDQVEEWLAELWSPEQIARRLRREHPDDPMMQVSHETIYQSLFVQGRGALKKELARCLRSGRVQRRPKNRKEQRGKIPDMVMISDRPAEVADRAVPGHWEGTSSSVPDARWSAPLSNAPLATCSCSISLTAATPAPSTPPWPRPSDAFQPSSLARSPGTRAPSCHGTWTSP